MSINSRLTEALEPTGILVTPDENEDDDPVYFVFNYDTVGTQYGCDIPHNEIALVQVHLHAPTNHNTVQLRRRVKQLLFAADFTWPDMWDASDKDGQHWVFECEGVEEVAPDGEA